MTNGNYVQVDNASCCDLLGNAGGNRAIELTVARKTNDNGDGTFTVRGYAKGSAYRKFWFGWINYNTNNDLGAHWEYSVTTNTGQTLTSIANYDYGNNFTDIDYDGDPMLFTGSPSTFYGAFNFTFNGNTYYHTGGVSPPGLIARCL